MLKPCKWSGLSIGQIPSWKHRPVSCFHLLWLLRAEDTAQNRVGNQRSFQQRLGLNSKQMLISMDCKFSIRQQYCNWYDCQVVIHVHLTNLFFFTHSLRMHVIRVHPTMGNSTRPHMGPTWFWPLFSSNNWFLTILKLKIFANTTQELNDINFLNRKDFYSLIYKWSYTTFLRREVIVHAWRREYQENNHLNPKRVGIIKTNIPTAGSFDVQNKHPCNYK